MDKTSNNNLLLFSNYREYFELLDGEDCKLLILLLYDFAENKVIDEYIKKEKTNVYLIYKNITDNMIIGSKRYVASVENGRKGGRPRKEDSIPTRKQKMFCKEHNIIIDGMSRIQVGKTIENFLSNEYREPTYNNIDVSTIDRDKKNKALDLLDGAYKENDNEKDNNNE